MDFLISFLIEAVFQTCGKDCVIVDVPALVAESKVPSTPAAPETLVIPEPISEETKDANQ